MRSVQSFIKKWLQGQVGATELMMSGAEQRLAKYIGEHSADLRKILGRPPSTSRPMREVKKIRSECSLQPHSYKNNITITAIE